MFWVALFRPVVMGSDVPQGVGEQSQDRPFAALVLDGKAVAQITGSVSLTWPALAHRHRTLTTDSLLAFQLWIFA